jgi:hypothetical protein
MFIAKGFLNIICCAKLVVKQGRKAMGLREEDSQAAKMN